MTQMKKLLVMTGFLAALAVPGMASANDLGQDSSPADQTDFVRRPGWPGGGGGGRFVTCYARNLRGQTFSASGNRPQFVQQRAMNMCQRNSFRCRPLGCN